MTYAFAGFFAPRVDGLAAAAATEWPHLVVREFDGSAGGATVIGAAIPNASVCVMAEGTRPYNRGEVERMGFALRVGLRAFSARFPGTPFVYLDVDRSDGETGAGGVVLMDGAEAETRESIEPDADARSSAIEMLRERLGVKLGRGRSFAGLRSGSFGPWPSGQPPIPPPEGSPPTLPAS